MILDNPKIAKQGVEDQEVHDAGLNLFNDAFNARKDSLGKIEQIQGALNALELKMFDDESRKLVETFDDFAKDRITLTSYAAILKNSAEKAGVNWQSFPNFAKVSQSIALEDTIDFTKLDRERLDMVDALEGKLEKKDADALISESLNYRLGRTSGAAYYNYLFDAAAKVNLDVSGFENVKNYSALVNLYAAIDDDALFSETEKLEIAIKKGLFNEDQLAFDSHKHAIEMIRAMVKTEVTSDEFNEFKTRQAEFNAVKTVDYVNSTSKNLGLSISLDRSLGSLDDALNTSVKFYENALMRDQIFVKNTLAMMDAKGWDTVVLVAGGFHSEGIVKALQAKAVSHMIVTPRITNPDAKNYWLEKMTGQPTEASKMIDEVIGAEAYAVDDEDPSKSMALTPAQITALAEAIKAGDTTAIESLTSGAGLEQKYNVSAESVDISNVHGAAKAGIESAWSAAGLNAADLSIKVVPTSDLLFLSNDENSASANMLRITENGKTTLYVAQGILDLSVDSASVQAYLQNVASIEAQEVIATQNLTDSAAIAAAIAKVNLANPQYLQDSLLVLTVQRILSDIYSGTEVPLSVDGKLKEIVSGLIGQQLNIIDPETSETAPIKSLGLDQIKAGLTALAEASGVDSGVLETRLQQAITAGTEAILESLANPIEEVISEVSDIEAQTLYIVSAKDFKMDENGLNVPTNVFHSISDKVAPQVTMIAENLREDSVEAYSAYLQTVTGREVAMIDEASIADTDISALKSENTLVVIYTKDSASSSKVDGLRTQVQNALGITEASKVVVASHNKSALAGVSNAVLVDQLSGINGAVALTQIKANPSADRVDAFVSSLTKIGKINDLQALRSEIMGFIDGSVALLDLASYTNFNAIVSAAALNEGFVGIYA